MILADKIIDLRKKAGLSQEELAEKMNVSRQAVSKWEGAQSTPDLARVLQLSEIFGVSTDYLLKDELEAAEAPETVVPDGTASQSEPLHRVSMEEANSFLEANRRHSGLTALGVALCIICAVPSILLEELDSRLANAFGATMIFVIISAAVALFIYSASLVKPFREITDGRIDTEYGVSGMVRERQEKFKPAYIRGIAVGVALCILSIVPVILTDAFSAEGWLGDSLAPALLLGTVAAGVYMIVSSSIVSDGFGALLNENRSADPDSKDVSGAVMGIFWLIVVAVYLAYSFITSNWAMSWLIFVIGAVLSGILGIVLSLTKKK